MGTAMTCGDVAGILMIDHEVVCCQPAMMVGSDSQEPVSVERSAAAKVRWQLLQCARPRPYHHCP